MPTSCTSQNNAQNNSNKGPAAQPALLLQLAQSLAAGSKPPLTSRLGRAHQEGCSWRRRGLPKMRRRVRWGRAPGRGSGSDVSPVCRINSCRVRSKGRLQIAHKLSTLHKQCTL
jgi:hypothetical protein